MVMSTSSTDSWALQTSNQRSSVSSESITYATTASCILSTRERTMGHGPRILTRVGFSACHSATPPHGRQSPLEHTSDRAGKPCDLVHDSLNESSGCTGAPIPLSRRHNSRVEVCQGCKSCRLRIHSSGSGSSTASFQSFAHTPYTRSPRRPGSNAVAAVLLHDSCLAWTVFHWVRWS